MYGGTQILRNTENTGRIFYVNQLVYRPTIDADQRFLLYDHNPVGGSLVYNNIQVEISLCHITRFLIINIIRF